MIKVIPFVLNGIEGFIRSNFFPKNRCQPSLSAQHEG